MPAFPVRRGRKKNRKKRCCFLAKRKISLLTRPWISSTFPPPSDAAICLALEESRCAEGEIQTRKCREMPTSGFSTTWRKTRNLLAIDGATVLVGGGSASTSRPLKLQRRQNNSTDGPSSREAAAPPEQQQ